MNEKDEILKILQNEPQKFIRSISSPSKRVDSAYLIDEFKNLRRNIRPTQVGVIQRRKIVGKGEARKSVDPVRIPIPFQNKIVKTGTAFEVGEPVTIIPSKEGELSSEIFRLWERNRLNADIQRAVFQRKSQLECAILFYSKNISKTQSFNRIKGVSEKREIKSKLLDNSKGEMTPIFDEFGDMILFCWSFTTTDFKNVVTNHTWVYDEKNRYAISIDGSGFSESAEIVKHGFDRIPVAYTSQEQSEWYEAETMIDRMEVALSKLGASNDYAGHPILKLYGEVKGMPDKDEDGKAIRISQKQTPNGDLVQGDAQFLTYDNAPEAVRLEMDRLEKYIHSMTSTPDITFHNIKGLGSISGYAIELMFMDAMIKAKGNNTIHNKPFIERCLNILISGIVTNLKTSLTREAESTIFDVKFNSILPQDLERSVLTYMNGVNSGIISVETAVKNLDIAHDINDEIEGLEKKETVERELVANKKTRVSE